MDLIALATFPIKKKNKNLLLCLNQTNLCTKCQHKSFEMLVAHPRTRVTFLNQNLLNRMQLGKCEIFHWDLDLSLIVLHLCTTLQRLYKVESGPGKTQLFLEPSISKLVPTNFKLQKGSPCFVISTQKVLIIN